MILDAIAKQPVNDIAIRTPLSKINYQTVLEQVERVYQWLRQNKIQVVVLQSDNTAEWLYIDLACQKAHCIFVPLAPFFTKQQCQYIIDSVKPDVVISRISNATTENANNHFVFSGFKIEKFQENNNLNRATFIPNSTNKITFTSGSTGTPKGVCLSVKNQFLVAQSLVERIAIKKPQHFCLLSFATLLENIAGIYAPLMSGGTLHILTTDERGFDGAQINETTQLLQALTQQQPNTLILVPELLQFLLVAMAKGWQAPTSFQFIAVGGSKVSHTLIEQAKQCSLPIYQGYGLSECASVVSLVSVDDNHLSDAHTGQVLPHLTTSLDNGQLVVSGNSFLGYLHAPKTWYQTQVKTGDLARFHQQNLEIIGRQSNLIINSFGRNISPEWLEAELLATGSFTQAIVFGDAKPYCIALLVASIDDNSQEQYIEKAIEKVNTNLPSYARIKKYLLLNKPLTYNAGLLTQNGRPKRQAIFQHFSADIAELYQQD